MFMMAFIAVIFIISAPMTASLSKHVYIVSLMTSPSAGHHLQRCAFTTPSSLHCCHLLLQILLIAKCARTCSNHSVHRIQYCTTSFPPFLAITGKVQRGKLKALDLDYRKFPATGFLGDSSNR